MDRGFHAGFNLASVPIHSPLPVSRPDDSAEQEADRAAERVMRGERAQLGRSRASVPAGKCAACNREEERAAAGEVRRQPHGNGSLGDRASPVVADVLRAPGRALAADVRGTFETAFGVGFSDVRIHTDATADAATRSIGARAFALDRHIAFAAGAYAPATRAGRRLLAHELAHVVQGAEVIGRQNGAQEEAEPAPAPGGAAAPAARRPAALTRPQEIALSQSSPGEFSITGPPVVITLYNFGINQSTLKARHREVLNAVGELVRSYGRGQGIVIRATGHADDTGEPEINDPLSGRRASAVAAHLTRAAGVPIVTEGRGENQPANTNDSAAGRSQNRRVEIRIEPAGAGPGQREPRPEDRRNEEPVQDRREEPGNRDPQPDRDPPRRDREEETRRWLCARHPILCALFGAGLALLILCLLRPAWCLPDAPTLPPPGPVPDPRRRRGPPQRRACIQLSSINLPSGTLRPNPSMPNYLHRQFVMEMDFLNDPATGCACECGEYRQFVKGFFRTIRPDGSQTTSRKVLAAGQVLSESLFQEDGDGRATYGHRSTVYAHNPDRDADEQEGYNDRFLPDRATGCQYRGMDNPGTMVGDSYPPGSTVIVHLDFMGVPVDTCSPGGPTPLTVPFFWEFRGRYTRPGPAPAPQPQPQPPAQPGGGGGPGGVGSAIPVTPRPYQGSVGPAPPTLRYAGGLSGVGVGPATMRLQYVRNGRTYEAAVPVIVTAADADMITITPANRTLINIAPPEDPSPAILIVPGRTARLFRSGL